MTDTETVLRRGLAACARATRTDPPPVDDLVARADGLSYVTVPGPQARRAPVALVAAAVVGVLAISSVAWLAGTGGDPTTTASTAAGPVPDGPVWHVTGTDPDVVAHDYLAAVVQSESPLLFTERNGDRATVHYGLNDVEATVELAADAQGRWMVTGASNKVVTLIGAVSRPGGLVVDLGPGSDRRSWTNVRLRLTAVADDGSALGSKLLEVNAEERTQISWDLVGQPVAVRADQVDLGHTAIRVDNPQDHGNLPPDFSVRQARPVFTGAGDADTVAEAYLRARLYESEFTREPVEQGEGVPAVGSIVVARWSKDRDAPGETFDGLLLMRHEASGWSVVAALTDDVDLSGLRHDGERISGTVTTGTGQGLGVDILDQAGTPVPGSPHPDGQPGAAHRWGTAGQGDSVAVDVPMDGQPGMVKVQLVGGGFLSISELWFEPDS